MRKVAAVFMLLVIWYFAGMYRQTSVMTLAVCALIFVLLLIGIAVYQRFNINIRPDKKQDIAFKKIEKTVLVRADNKGIFPLNRYKLFLSVNYSGDKKKLKKKFTGCAWGKNGDKDDLSEFYLTAPYCGLIDIHFKRAKIYDNIALFSVPKKLRESGQLMVFPVEKNMNIIMPMTGFHDNIPLVETLSEKSGDDHSEVRLIREYRPGDLYRHIHRNYSARTDNLWVKEYRKENDFIFDVFLDTSSDGPVPPQILDSFYEIVFSVIINLCRKDIVIMAHWYDKEKNGIVDLEITKENQCFEMLARLFLTDTSCSRQTISGSIEQFGDKCMVISTGLEWRLGTRPIHRFDPQNTETELATNIFDLR